MVDQPLAGQLALHFLQTRPDPTKSSPGLIAQMAHRLALVDFWSITPGSRILELGCGQGDTTVPLAHAIGPEGHIDAVDPGSPDYGTPPLKDAQAHILASPLGGRITFHHASATGYAETYTGKEYDYIVLAHSIWYFENPTFFPSLMHALTPHLENGKTKLCIAEWSLSSRRLEGVPHVMAALLRSLLEAKRPTPSAANIRTVLSPAQLKSIATSSPLKLRLLKEVTADDSEGMMDGEWEVGYTLRKREADMKRLEDSGVSLAERTQVDAYFDSIQAAVDGLGGIKGVRCMDFWAGVFGR